MADDTGDTFAPLLAELERMTSALDAGQRRRLAMRMGRELRRSQSKRIAAQQNPDGSPFQPRKPRERHGGGAIRRGAMFRKLRQQRWFRIRAMVDGLELGFTPAAARIARVHQLGLVDRVSKEPGSPEVRYPVRQLIGFTEDEIRMLVQMAAEALDGVG